ncbi:heterokaryon incompatibility, partial [Lophiotrema nucula]
FEALSYVWGSAEKPVIATIEEGSASFSFPIGLNLACAMRYIRLVDSPRAMWIDAICINQEDMQERGTQVQRMVDIYALASKVVVWIGELTPRAKPPSF